MTALCSLPAADLALAVPTTGTLEVFYGPIGSNGYALVIGDTLSMVSPLKRCVVNGTADAASWRTHLDSLADGDSELAQTVTVYEQDGVLSLIDTSDEDTKPSKAVHTDAPETQPDPRGTPQIKPLPSFSSLLPMSSTYHILNGILTLAELFTQKLACKPGAQVRHDALRRSWDVRVSARTAYRVQVTGTATELTSYLRTADGWRALETVCLPALPLHEQYRLFMHRSSSR